MALDAQQRIRLARVINADLDLRQITGPEKVQELLRLLVLPPQQQQEQMRQAIVRVRAVIQGQQADAPGTRQAQDQSWQQEVTVLADLETNL